MMFINPEKGTEQKVKWIHDLIVGLGIRLRYPGQEDEMKYYIRILESEIEDTKKFLKGE